MTVMRLLARVRLHLFMRECFSEHSHASHEVNGRLSEEGRSAGDRRRRKSAN